MGFKNFITEVFNIKKKCNCGSIAIYKGIKHNESIMHVCRDCMDYNNYKENNYFKEIIENFN